MYSQRNKPVAGRGDLSPTDGLPFLISIVAGGPSAATPVSAVNAALRAPQTLATDNSGDFHIVGSPAPTRYPERRTSRSFSGNGFQGYSGDGEPVSDASLVCVWRGDRLYPQSFFPTSTTTPVYCGGLAHPYRRFAVQ